MCRNRRSHEENSWRGMPSLQLSGSQRGGVAGEPLRRHFLEPGRLGPGISADLNGQQSGLLRSGVERARGRRRLSASTRRSGGCRGGRSSSYRSVPSGRASARGRSDLFGCWRARIAHRDLVAAAAIVIARGDIMVNRPGSKDNHSCSVLDCLLRVPHTGYEGPWEPYVPRRGLCQRVD